MTKHIKGVLGTKLGMSQVFDAEGRMVPVTVVEAGPCVVTAVRTPDAHGYSAVQLGYGEIDPRRVTKPVAGHFAKAAVTPRRYLAELRTDDATDYTLGQEVTAETFAAGDLVDVTGRSKGKGTAGVMKRHGFKGLSASHGTQRKHRSPGSIGGCATPGRVFKGVRMAGRMGNARTTTPNLTVHAVDAERGLLLIRGAVPGPKGGLILVRSAIRAAQSATKETSVSTKVSVVSPSGAKGQDVELPDEIFSAPVNVPLMHQVVVAQEAAARQGTHATKTRGLVRGGGRKPYRQKGTGRARQGSVRAPQYAGGGTVHGPQPRSYVQRTPKKMKAAALRGALSDRASNSRVAVVSGFVSGDAPKTGEALDVLRAAIGLTGAKLRGTVLVVAQSEDELTWKSLRNVRGVRILAAGQLNTYDVLVSEHVVFTQAALEEFTGRGPTAKKEDEQ